MYCTLYVHKVHIQCVRYVHDQRHRRLRGGAHAARKALHDRDYLLFSALLVCHTATSAQCAIFGVREERGCCRFASEEAAATHAVAYPRSLNVVGMADPASASPPASLILVTTQTPCAAPHGSRERSRRLLVPTRRFQIVSSCPKGCQ
ncbi:hypothetical protein L209DRAFT_81199 [Thermothelomyces heterothallicus CBS 203.75]